MFSKHCLLDEVHCACLRGRVEPYDNYKSERRFVIIFFLDFRRWKVILLIPWLFDANASCLQTKCVPSRPNKVKNMIKNPPKERKTTTAQRKWRTENKKGSFDSHICDGEEKRIQFMHGDVSVQKRRPMRADTTSANGFSLCHLLLVNWKKNCYNFCYSLLRIGKSLRSFVLIVGWFLMTDAFGISNT